ncbi:protein NO VEIN domain-containing protein [Virgisporangium aliadipatigenens]|uniref:protein NO VEIN domain-containing protein n=1 Tax=Virgisporangium aliadipatigenens TaxID=741659 RepID=UPI003570BFB5
MYSPATLREAEAALLHANLILRVDRRIRPTDQLVRLRAFEDRDAVEILAVCLAVFAGTPDHEVNPDAPSAPLTDPDQRAEIGAAAEDFVLDVCRRELDSLGRSDLAAKTQRVSLISDSLGFDILAPVIGGASRRLEVKGQSTSSRPFVRFFLTRNEFEVGRRCPEWSLVCCQVGSSPNVVGWCKAGTLAPYLPQDRNGRWTEALVTLPISTLFPGLPDPI